MSQQYDLVGFPIDPEIRALFFSLYDLAAEYYLEKRDNNVEKQKELVRIYCETLQELYSKGWDIRLDVYCVLPDELMPEEYHKRREIYIKEHNIPQTHEELVKQLEEARKSHKRSK